MNPVAPPILELQAASKRYGEVVALAPTTLAVERGRTTALIGPSGCGKSTVLRLMVGLIRADSGRVCFDGTELVPSNAGVLRRRMGYVVQDGGLFPHLTNRDNVCLMARQLGWPAGRVQTRLQELAALVRLPSAILTRFPAQISGGQQQRVALMRALMLDPEVLLLDEPMGALDPLVRAELQDDLAGVFSHLGKSVVLVTHDLAEAAFLGHVVVLLKDGGVVQRGSIDDLIQRPAEPFVSRFVQAQRRFLGQAPEPGLS